MKRAKTNKAKTTEEVLHGYLDRAEKIFMPPSQPFPNFVQPEKPKFEKSQISETVINLVGKIIEALDGNTIEDIMLASNIVEQYVGAQNKYSVYPSVAHKVGKLV
jgi:hypothetical protein